MLYRSDFASPLGPFTIVVDDDGRLHVAGWRDRHARMMRHFRGPFSHSDDPAGLATAFSAYFFGDLHALDDVEVVYDGTSFQRSVWKALRTIPCGETRSYGELARSIGNPRAVRAVGLANGCNPVSIVVPCHRVIGANGTLTGYGGGLSRKQWLLEHEHPQATLPLG